jgi:ribosomal protein S18 acetylase RimI-like enzyme
LSTIRPAKPADHDQVWAILEPVFRAGDTYAIRHDISREEALEFWLGGSHTAYVCEVSGTIRGSYYICTNQQGGGDHVCNCGFATDPAARGQGVARKMLSHALNKARACGFRAMQFNFVVETNHAALKIWADNGFEQVGRLPNAFRHPAKGFIDALVLYKTL